MTGEISLAFHLNSRHLPFLLEKGFGLTAIMWSFSFFSLIIKLRSKGLQDTGLICLPTWMTCREGLPGRGPRAPEDLPTCVLWVTAWLRDPGERPRCCVSMHFCKCIHVCLHHSLRVHAGERLCCKPLFCPVSPP